MKYGVIFVSFCMLMGFSSCFKKDLTVELPAIDSSLIHTEFYLGDNYEDQLFYSLSSHNIVHSSKFNLWDLAFENGDAGFHIFMNGGKDVQLLNVGQHTFSQYTQLLSTSTDWGFDDPSWDYAKTYVGDWRINTQAGKPDLFLANLGGDTIMKIIFLSVNARQYTIQFGSLADPNPQTITIPKNNEYPYSYFSFNKGGEVVYPDAKTKDFDLVFTRYKHIYYDLFNFPYLVNGAMLNTENVSATIDSVHSFEEINASIIPDYKFSRERDIIGFDWKIYDINQGVYTVRKKNTYIIRRNDGTTWKLKFISFYNKNGLKGYPSFEYKQIN